MNKNGRHAYAFAIRLFSTRRVSRIPTFIRSCSLHVGLWCLQMQLEAQSRSGEEKWK